jgi:WhiB family redox-sensing transcriptional regulator
MTTQELPVEERWKLDAACRQHPRVNFFPDWDDGAATDDAIAVCAGCGVRLECLEYALRHRCTAGVWGGVSERELRHLVRRRTAAVAAAVTA